MATSSTEVEPAEPLVEPAPMEEWFDRSSITIDAMVTIEGVSEEDWWRYAPEGRVCEFDDGVVYMPSPASPEHQLEVGFWHVLVDGFLEEREPGKMVQLGPGVLRLAPRRYYEPDVFVVPTGPGPHVPPASLVIEVLSKSTRRGDLVRKAARFQEAGIPEFVFVDQKNQCLIVHKQIGDAYQKENIASGFWISAALPGFWVDTAWLWQDPLPSRRRCLEQVLVGPPA